MLCRSLLPIAEQTLVHPVRDSIVNGARDGVICEPQQRGPLRRGARARQHLVVGGQQQRAVRAEPRRMLPLPAALTLAEQGNVVAR